VQTKLIEGTARLGFRLDPHQLSLFETYYRELIEWNRRVNLTAITEYERVQSLHFLDSLTVLPLLPPGAIRVLDVGSGAGLPGVPIKIARPEIELTLLEARAKKTAFLRHLVSILGLEGVEVITGRAEEFAHRPGCRENFTAVLSRALAKLPVAVELCLPFCEIGGLYISYKKGRIEDEVEEALPVIELLGGRLEEVRPVALPELAGERYLVVVGKASPSPEAYPRRPGIPQKRPLRTRG